MDFSKMKFSVNDVPLNKSVLKEIPELAELFAPFAKDLKGHIGGITADQLVRYTCYCYDKGTPLISEMDMMKRKIMAMELSGKKLDASDPSNPAWGIVLLRNEFANHIKLHYLRFQNSVAWYELVQISDAYFQIINALTSEETDQKKGASDIALVKAKVWKETKDIRRDKADLASQLFGEDLKLEDFVMSYMEGEQKRMIVIEDYVNNKAAFDEV